MTKIILNILVLLLSLFTITGAFNVERELKFESKLVAAIFATIFTALALYIEAYCGTFNVWTMWQYLLIIYTVLTWFLQIYKLTTIGKLTLFYKILSSFTNDILLFGCGFFYPLLHWAGIQ